jgi:hypothetical protein
MAFGNGQITRYRSSITNEPRQVTGRCPLLITHIRNGHQTTTVTTTSHRSREMAVSLGPTENFGNRHQNRARYSNSTSETCSVKLHLRCLDEMRCIYFTRVSTQLGFVTGTKEQPLPQLVTSHVKMTVSLDPQGTLVMGTRTEPVTVNQYRRCVQ